MIIDIHCHVGGNGKDIENVDNDVYFDPYDNQKLVTNVLYYMLFNEYRKMGAVVEDDNSMTADNYFRFIYELLKNTEEIDAIVLLAMDACYNPKNGELMKKETDLFVSNKYLYNKINELNLRFENENIDKRFFFGASVNPNREDWESEMNYVLTQTDAVLFKLIPSAHNVKLNDSRYVEFYRQLAINNKPLLCHVGPEYSFPGALDRKALDNFRNLVKPLENGVTVIAAHCAAPVFPIIDCNTIKEFSDFMYDANRDKIRLYGDTSALSLSFRLPFISQILNEFDDDWLVHGSDFPIPIDGGPHLPIVTHDVSFSEYDKIMNCDNPFDRDVLIKRAHGFSDFILTNTAKILNHPAIGEVN